MSDRQREPIGGLAAVFAHPDDESFTAAGALALAHDAGRTVRLLLLTRGEAGNAERSPDLDLADTREEEMRCAAAKIGMDEVTVVDHPDGRLSEVPFSTLVDEIAVWLADRRPDAVITFGAHGVTNDADHVVVGAATRWAVERLAESGIAPHAVYVVAPIFGPVSADTTSPRRRGPPAIGSRSPRSPGASSRAGLPRQPVGHGRGDRRAARRARPRGGRVRGLHPRATHRPRRPPDLLLEAGLRGSRESLLDWSAMTIDSNLAKVDEVMTALYDIHDPEIGMSIVDLDLIKHVEIGVDGAPTEIKMILTTPFCPWAGELIQTVKEKTEGVVGPPSRSPCWPIAGSPRPASSRVPAQISRAPARVVHPRI